MLFIEAILLQIDDKQFISRCFPHSSHPHSTHHLIRSNKIHKRMFIHIFVKGQNFVAKNCNMYCNNVNKIKICIGN